MRIPHFSERTTHDDGFGLVEAAIATMLMVILVIVSIGPIMFSFDLLDTSRFVTEAEKLGEAKLESIKALDFDDVGLVSGVPTGVILASEVVPLTVDWVIDVDIRWEGKINGSDEVNYKVIDITVTHPDNTIPPISFSTTLSPDRLSDGANKASVTVDLILMEPSPSFMLTPPQVFLVKSNGLGVGNGAVFPLPGATGTQFKFPLLNPTDDNVGDPNYEMVMRLGTTLADTDSVGWYIDPATLEAFGDTFQLFPAELKTTTLPIYRPAQLEVFVEDTGGAPINNASLKVDNGVSSETFTTTDGHFFIDTLLGYPLPTDIYDLTVSASGYVAELRAAVAIPSGYPVPLHTETFNLAVQVGESIDFLVQDNYGYVIPNATVSVPSVLDGVTDEFGKVTMFVPAGPNLATVTNETGFAPAAKAFDSGDGTVTVTMLQPSGYRVVHVRNAGDGDHWGYRERNSTDAYVEVPRDFNGNGTMALTKNQWWDLTLACDPDDTTFGWQKNKWVNSFENVSAGGASC